MLDLLYQTAGPAPRPEVCLAALAACAVVSYLVCGIPFGEIIGKAMGGVDLRRAGSGNIGTTNALRVAGPKVAALTLLCDVGKGVLCVNLSRAVIAAAAGVAFWGVVPGASGDVMLALVCAACLCGHVFSPYLHFHGGKGIAVGVGVLFAWFWPQALVHLLIFIALVAATRYVSVGSIVTAAAVPVTTALMVPGASLGAKAAMSLMGVIAVWAHRTNIKKLLAHKESKLSFHKRTDRMDPR